MGLREEISVLRRRADDALDQKWQCEKGLAGLKMDLDRAEQETSSLRNLLQEQAHMPPGSQGEYPDFQATATSLEMAYQQFQAESQGSNSGNLADAVRQRVARNSSLKERLSKAIGQGERDQQLSVTRINEMQARLKELEDKLMLAQQHSEEEVAKHEQEVNALKESHNAQLQRLMNGDRSPGRRSPILPNSPFSGGRSPRLSRTSSGEAVALNQAVQTGDLEAKVKNLEKALREADLEMSEVVSRMNKAQMEVAELQSDRYETRIALFFSYFLSFFFSRLTSIPRYYVKQRRSSPRDSQAPIRNACSAPKILKSRDAASFETIMPELVNIRVTFRYSRRYIPAHTYTVPLISSAIQKQIPHALDTVLPISPWNTLPDHLFPGIRRIVRLIQHK